MENDNYLNIKEIDKGNEISSDFTHKHCWDAFLKQIGNVDESMTIIRGLKSWFVKQGILPGEEFTIKWC